MQLKSTFRLYFLLFFFYLSGIFIPDALGQDCNTEITIEIQDAENGDPLAGAAIWINELDVGKSANDKGIVKFSNLCNGQK